MQSTPVVRQTPRESCAFARIWTAALRETRAGKAAALLRLVVDWSCPRPVSIFRRARSRRSLHTLPQPQHKGRYFGGSIAQIAMSKEHVTNEPAARLANLFASQ